MKTGAQGARHAVVGAPAFCVDFGEAWPAIKALPFRAANTIGFIVANVFNFLPAHGCVFGAKVRTKTDCPGLRRGSAVSVVGLPVNNAVVWVPVGLVGMGLMPRTIMTTLVGLGWNFTARKFWIYESESP